MYIIFLICAVQLQVRGDTVKFSLGPEEIQPYPSPHPYQFPDAAIAVLGDPDSRLMFWSDGLSFRVEGTGVFPSHTPSPLTPVLGAGPPGSYDANGNWMLAVFRLENRSTLVGFTHVENHKFDCPGGYAEWNGAAVVSSVDEGVTWVREGAAVLDPQPCKPTFGGSGYSSVIRVGDAFLGFGGCTGYRSLDPRGAPGTWMRFKGGSFSSPGVNGSSDCLPGVPQNACCPIVHFNSFLNKFFMVFNKWGQDSTLLASVSDDGISWEEPVVLVQAQSNRSLAYGQVIGDTNNSVAGETAILAYAAAPPTGAEPRDFIFRSISFSLQRS